MIPILSLIHCILEQPLASGDQSVQWGRDRDKEDEGLGGFFQSGHLKNQASPGADTGQRSPAEGPPQESLVQLVTPAPPQETAPRIPGRPEGLCPSSLRRIHHARIGQERPLTTPGANGPRRGRQSLPRRTTSPQSSASPRDCEQPFSTSGKSRPAIFARPTSGPSLGAAPHRK